MKRTCTVLLLSLASFFARAQGVSDYYKTARPSPRQYDRLVVRYDSYLSERWYISGEGFLRSDASQLNNTFGGLVTANRVTRPGWSAVVGWTFRDKWAFEAGYANSPIHNKLTVSTGEPPFVAQYENDRHALLLRGKWQALSTSRVWRRSGIWLTGGAWMVPNSLQQTDRFSLDGHNRRSFLMAPQQWHLYSRTRTSNSVTGLVELGAEYNVRLNSRLELGFYARKYWGLGSSITTKLDYVATDRPQQTAEVRGTGQGSSFGLAVRYTYSRHHKVNNVYDVKGNPKSRL